jgi:hypothetical protein
MYAGLVLDLQFGSHKVFRAWDLGFREDFADFLLIVVERCAVEMPISCFKCCFNGPACFTWCCFPGPEADGGNLDAVVERENLVLW